MEQRERELLQVNHGMDFWNSNPRTQNRNAERWIPPLASATCSPSNWYRRLFLLMKSVAEVGEVPDLANCYRVLIDRGKKAQEVGLPQLSDLAFSNQVDLVNLEPWIRRLREKAAAREAWRMAESLRTGLEAGIDGPNELATALEELRVLQRGMAAPTTTATLADAVGSIGMDNLLAAPGRTVACWSPNRNRQEHVLPAVGG
jgi:hypothetical protein